MIKKVFLICILFSAFIACKDNSSKNQSIETEEISFTRDGELNFLNKDGEEIVKLDIEVAEDEYEQQTGLMYRKEMKKNRGMLFVYKDEKPRPYFYMKNTYIGLDLIYINAAREVVEMNLNAEPLSEKTLSSEADAQYVLEVNAGMAEKWGLEIGDKVTFNIK